MLKVNNKDTKPESGQCRRPSVFLINFEHILNQFSSVSMANFEHVFFCWGGFRDGNFQ